MKQTEIPSSRCINLALFLVLCCLCQLSRASPKDGRQPVTYLSGKVPLPPLYKGASENGLGGDVRKRGTLKSGYDETDAVAREEEEEYYEDDIYDLAQFWYTLTDYAQDLVYETNLTFSSELSEVNQKLEDLESSLADRDEEITSLREQLEKLAVEDEMRQASLGDVRLIHQEEENGNTRGILMFYAGDSFKWGYVCDDLFSSVAATVACRQLGYSSGKVDGSREMISKLDLQDRKRTFVLDDVICSAQDADLLSCEHPPIGVHNCFLSEAVSVQCSH